MLIVLTIFIQFVILGVQMKLFALKIFLILQFLLQREVLFLVN